MRRLGPCPYTVLGDRRQFNCPKSVRNRCVMIVLFCWNMELCHSNGYDLSPFLFGTASQLLIRYSISHSTEEVNIHTSRQTCRHKHTIKHTLMYPVICQPGGRLGLCRMRHICVVSFFAIRQSNRNWSWDWITQLSNFIYYPVEIWLQFMVHFSLC